ncbi:MAG TPA: HupE/UreJ family protein [Xanthobacteraceae bacterium]|nr:HupE/UreJ family protein [Xanthobacteraceae bacterium]
MRLKLVLPGLALLLATPAYAHTGMYLNFSFESGFLHPLHGLDHLLAMFAVGLLAAQLGGRAIWLVPGAFVAMMIAGALLGMSGVEIPGAELGILLSVIAIALPVTFAFGMPAPAAMAYVGVFALFHGAAHSAELPAGADTWPYIAGFALATALLHAAGIAVGLACGRVAAGQDAFALRATGGIVVLAGACLAVA